MKPIDYQPLSAMESIGLDGRQLDFSNLSRIVNKTNGLFLGLGVLVAIVILIGAAALFKGIFFWILIIAAGIMVVVITTRLSKQEIKVWREFATVNGWSILPKESVAALVPPAVAKMGHSHRSSEAASGSFNQIPFYLFEHEYTIGYGKGAQTFAMTIFSLKVNANLPQILITPKNGSYVDTGQLKEKLKLEGDFSQYFKIHVQPEAEVDDLTILTPDVMQFMISNGSKYNFAIGDNFLHIIAGGDLRRINTLPPLFDFSFKFYAQVMQNLPMAKLTETAPTPLPVPS